MTKICPKCGAIAGYDKYYSKFICTRCSWEGETMEDLMIEQVSWDEFRDNGMLWWINRQLQLFGYSIVVNINEYGEVESAYPVKSKFRGFTEDCEAKGFEQLTEYLKSNIDEISKDI